MILRRVAICSTVALIRVQRLAQEDVCYAYMYDKYFFSQILNG